MKKNILIISIYYPPTQSIASNRIYSFAKYLDKEKYNVYVHTIDEGKVFHNNLDHVKISRIKNSSFFKPMSFNKRTNKLTHNAKVLYNIIIRFFTQDIYQTWVRKSVTVVSKIVEKENIDVIISSFAPTASHRIGVQIKRKYPQLKWIADMRDEMSASPFISAKTRKGYEDLEQIIFKNGDAITSVSRPILDEFKQMSNGSNLIFKEIRNGYDFEIGSKSDKNHQFTIAYVGNFYGEINPNNFFSAFSELVKNNKIHNFQIKFIGVKTHFEIPKNLKESLLIMESVSHGDAIQEMKNSDALLLIHPNNGRKGVFTGKIFEYLATLKPIIALVDADDVAAKLIRECNAGHVSNFDDIEDIKKAIIDTYNEWKENSANEVNIEIIKKHHRKEQVKRLENLIEELING